MEVGGKYMLSSSYPKLGMIMRSYTSSLNPINPEDHPPLFTATYEPLSRVCLARVKRPVPGFGVKGL